MSEPSGTPDDARTYLIGLPVAVTVHTDGTVTYDIDTAEAGIAVADCEQEDLPTEAVISADVAAIEADHHRRTLQEG